MSEWKLVPVEPTNGMVFEGAQREGAMHYDLAAAVYRAMLAAAPAAPAGDVAGLVQLLRNIAPFNPHSTQTIQTAADVLTRIAAERDAALEHNRRLSDSREHAIRERDAARAEAEGLRELLAEVEVTLRHARTFIVAREKMHPDGIDLYDKGLAKVRAALAREKEGK